MFPNLKEIRKKRKILDLTQKQLSKISSVSQSMIAKIESGKIDPSYSTVQKLFITLENLENPKRKKCVEVMNKKLICIEGDQTLETASKIMHKYSISQLPVKEKNSIIGLISEDLLLEKIQEGEKYEKIIKMKVKEIMDNPLPTVDKNFYIEQILPLIKISGAILILDKNKPIGIITKSDLI